MLNEHKYFKWENNVRLCKTNKTKQIKMGAALTGFTLLFLSGVAMASTQTLGGMASNVISSFAAIGKLITAGSYIAGLAFSVGAIMKFKQHKDNATQIPIGQPIGLILIAAALLFMPTLLETLGATMFGTATTAGPGGTTITKVGG
jgi:intracellular multiplication protein IcmD